MLKDAQMKDAQISEEQTAAMFAEDILNVHIADEKALDEEAILSAQDPDNIKRLKELMSKVAA